VQKRLFSNQSIELLVMMYPKPKRKQAGGYLWIRSYFVDLAEQIKMLSEP
jgi:hypothetical protein